MKAALGLSSSFLLAAALVSVSLAQGDTSQMVVTGAPAVVAAEDSEPEDPFPITRIRVLPNQLDAALRTLDAGPVVRLPRKEFEARVLKAARAAAERRDPPRLVEAKYSAALAGNDLAGEALWVIVNRQGSPALLTLEPLKLAVQAPTWADGSEAILGLLPPGTAPAVWVPPGRQTLKIRWSAAGTGFGTDRQFDIRVPGCPRTAMELELPQDRTPTNPAEVLLTGPFPGVRDPKLRSWQFRFGERSRLEFGVRGPSETTSPVEMTSLTARYDATGSQLACSFECDLRTARGTTTEWAFTVPPGVAVSEVVTNDYSAWRFETATRLLRIGLRQPANSGKVAINAVSAIPGRGLDAALPMIRPAQAIGHTERLDLRISSGLELERFDPADYRITESSLMPDGSRSMVLVGSLLPPGSALAFRRMPSLRLSGAGTDFTTRESLEWKIDRDKVHLTARVEVKVRRGLLFRLAFRTPPGLAVDRIATGTEEAAPHWVATTNGLELEFEKPLIAGQRSELRFELRGQPVALPASMPFPAFAPLGVSEREGWISFSPDAGWSVHPLPGPGAEAAWDFDWPEDAPSNATHLYFYRGLEPTGSVTVTPLPPVFTASLQSMGEGANAVTRVTIEPRSGQLAEVRIFDPTGAERSWKLTEDTNSITGATRFDLGRLSRGRYWRLLLSRPATGKFVLESSGSSTGVQILGATELRVQSGGEETKTQTPLEKAWSFEGLYLITVCGEQGAEAIFGGTILTRGAPALPVTLPSGAVVCVANIAGHWMESGRCDVVDGCVNLPLPGGQTPTRFEVRYLLPTSPGIIRRVVSPPPVLPGEGFHMGRWWVSSEGLTAIWPMSLRGKSSSADVPVLLGESQSRTGTDREVFRSDMESVTLMPAPYLEAGGAALAAFTGLLGWVGWRRASRDLGLLLLLLLFAVVAAYWLGLPSWQRTGSLLLVTAVVSIGAVSMSRGWWSRRALSIVIILGCMVPSVRLCAQTSESRDVALVVADPAGEFVVVPKPLLERLEQLQRPPGPLIVATSSSYEGRIEDGFARFTARIAVHSFQDGEAVFEFPLSDVRLERATVDGRPAQPMAWKQDAYAVPVSGKGNHEIELRFAVTPAASGPEREVRLEIPEVCDTRVTFIAPPTARQIQAVGRMGELRTSNEKDGSRVQAALGGVRMLHIRWREGAGGSTAAVSVREGCIWDLSESSHQLTACYQLQIQAGSVTSLRFDLPVALEPKRVAVRSLDSILSPAAARDWSVGKEVGALRPLTINLLGPTDGRVLVVIECESKSAPTRQPLLTFPHPAGMNRTSALYGMRISGVTVESIARSGVIDFASDALTREFGSVPDLRLSPQNPVVVFSPRAGEAAELRPVLRITAEPPVVSQQVTWNVNLKQAIGHGTLKWTASEPVALLEFATPATILEVRGTEVASWAQVERRVQVWLRKPAKEATVEWIGSASIDGGFELPIPVPAHARLGSQSVGIRPASGLGVRIERDKGWKPSSGSRREWVFQSEGAVPAPRLQLVQPPAAVGRGFATVEFSSTNLTYRAAVEITLTPSLPHHLTIQASGLPANASVVLDVPPGTTVHASEADGDSQSWNLNTPGDAASSFRATLTVSLPLKPAISLPTIDFRTGGSPGAARGVVRGFGLSSIEGIVRVDGAVQATDAEAAEFQTAWPGEALRLRRFGGAYWRSNDGRMTLIFPQTSGMNAPAPSIPSALPSESSAPRPFAPIFQATLWCSSVIVLLIMFVRWPHGSWPEQVGLLFTLLGYAITGGLYLGLTTYVVTRSAWFISLILRPRIR